MTGVGRVQQPVVPFGLGGQLLWTVRRAQWLLVALHLLFVLVPVVITIVASQDPPRAPFLLVSVVLAMGAIQLRHSLAAARGERPHHWPWTFLALAVLVYLPMVWLTWRWWWAMWFVIGSAAMLLPRRPAVAVISVQPLLAVLLHHQQWAPVRSFHDNVLARSAAGGPSITASFWLVVYLSVVLLMGGGCLYAAARLVRAVDELHDARAELARVAVGRERLRISRDLHDLLGHSLSAISLKGDLALRLLSRDPDTARAEIEGLTTVARDALGDVRAVTRHEREPSFGLETEGAVTLLAAAGIRTCIDDTALPALAPPVDVVLGWAVREGVTNILRHSDAATCSITAVQRDGTIVVEIENDGAAAPTGEGSGLVGLAERARQVSGTAVGQLTGDGRFLLRVEIPQEIS